MKLCLFNRTLTEKKIKLRGHLTTKAAVLILAIETVLLKVTHFTSWDAHSRVAHKLL